MTTQRPLFGEFDIIRTLKRNAIRDRYYEAIDTAKHWRKVSLGLPRSENVAREMARQCLEEARALREILDNWDNDWELD